ncbi:hypothetical protein ACFT5B_04870 [Luteimicrobium sp. NPDC057192]|uniref:hypothetical protein n=1 Tax=Luteimicrobium sp. NPDC057192 TaxID=3346042 RepID=UPI0036422B5A
MSTTPDPAGPAARPDDARTTPADDVAPPVGPGSERAEPEPEPERAEPEREADPEEPVEVELPADAKVEATDVDVTELVEGRARRAPRYQNFLKAGALLGAVLGLVVGGLMLSRWGGASIDKPGVLFSLVVLGGICLGLAVSGLLALLADRRSLGRRRG